MTCDVSLLVRGVVATLVVLVVGGVISPSGCGPWSAQSASAQPDSVRAEILQRKGYPPNHSPRGALWRSLAVPGWGQVYNRQYYKLPFVYGGLAGMGYAVYTTNQSYVQHRHAAIYAQGQSLENRGDDIPDVISDYERFRDDYAELVREANGPTDDLESLPLSASQLRDRRDKLRRYRDLSIVGTGLFYALTMVDAYVSAHLLSFDVGDELAMGIVPTGQMPDPTLAARAGPTATRAPSDRGATHAVRLPHERALTMGPGVSVRVRF